MQLQKKKNYYSTDLFSFYFLNNKMTYIQKCDNLYASVNNYGINNLPNY